MNQIQFLDVYKDNRDHARHHEAQRTTVSNLIIFTSAGISSIISLDRDLTLDDLPLTCFIIFLGLFGVVFSIKYGFRIGYHLSVSRKILEHVSADLFATVSRFQRASEAESPYPEWIVKPQNTKYWIVLHSCIIFYSAVLALFCVLDWFQTLSVGGT